MLRLLLSLVSRPDQARVAAILAPGLLFVFELRDLLGVLEPLSDLFDRNVVRIVCFSGLSERSPPLVMELIVLLDGLYGGKDGRETVCDVAFSRNAE